MGIPWAETRAGAPPELFERVTRLGVSRRQFVQRGAVVVGGLAGLDLLGAAPAFAKRKTADPRPIPGGFTLPDFQLVPNGAAIHVLPPSPPFEMSTITDFEGVIGAAEIQGSATGSDGSSYAFDADMRFMRGEYIGMDGREHEGTFGFI